MLLKLPLSVSLNQLIVKIHGYFIREFLTTFLVIVIYSPPCQLLKFFISSLPCKWSKVTTYGSSSTISFIKLNFSFLLKFLEVTMSTNIFFSDLLHQFTCVHTLHEILLNMQEHYYFTKTNTQQWNESQK